MSKPLFCNRFLLAILVSLAAAPFAVADITSVVVYGDSLSDNGNLFAATGQPPLPYYNGRYSNGPVAVEQLASRLGVPLHDFAWGGATTGLGNYGDGGTPTSLGAHNLPGMEVEFSLTAATVPGLAPGALFVVWGGPNDFLSPSPLDATPAAVVNRAVADLTAIVVGLQALGAQQILVPGMPDLGLTPYYVSLGPAKAAEGSALTDAFNAALVSSLPAGVRYYDTAALMRAAVANPAAYGFTNVTAPCFNGATVCASPDEYLFWDGFHPTTAMATYAAEGFANTAVPEPASIGLLGGVILALGLRLRAARITR